MHLLAWFDCFVSPATIAEMLRLVFRSVAALVVLAVLSSSSIRDLEGATQESDQDTAKKDLPLEPGRSLEFTASEGTWMSLDVSPDGGTIVFDLLGDLYTMPIAGGRATRLTQGMAYDVQPRFSPDGQRVAFVSDRSGSENVWIMSVDGADTVQLTKGKTGDVLSPEWTPDGEYVVASKGNRGLKLWLFHVDGGSGVEMHAGSEQTHMAGPAFGSDGQKVWYASRDGRHQYNAVFPLYQISVYDRETGTATTMTSRYGSAVRPTLSPDGRWLVYGTRHRGETGLRIRDLNDGSERWLAYPVQRDDQESVAPMDALPGFSFTPDSRSVVASYGGKIWRIDAQGGSQTEIPFTADVAVDLGPEVRFDYEVEVSPTMAIRQIRDGVPSPDGSKLAFVALDRLYVMEHANGTPRRLTNLAVGEHNPSWSPDGRWISFVSWDDAAGGHIYKVRSDATGATPERVTQASRFYRETAWSPDGQRIVSIRGAARDVQENRGGFGGGLGTEFVWVPAAGGPETVIAPTSGRDGAHFTTDGDRIYAYHRERGLVSFRWDGTDEQSHVKVEGARQPGATQSPPASAVFMAPTGDQALAQVGMDLYTVTVPIIGGDTPTIDVSDPDNAAFPVRRLTNIGGQFPAWGRDARTVHWGLGNAHVVYDLDRAEFVTDSIADASGPTDPDDEDAESEDDDAGYEPEEHRIVIEVARDVPEGTVVLRGGRAVTMRGSEIIENADIVVRNDRIVAVGPRGQVDVPSNAEIVDITGKVVTPGFVDTHYHTQWLLTDVHSNQVWQYLTNLAYGVTTTQDVQTATTDILTYHDRVETGQMLGPRIYHTGPGVFSGENVKSLEHAKEILTRYKEYYGLNTFKMYMAGNRQQRQWLIMAARELELMPTVEGGIDFKLNMTHAIDGYPGMEHSLPIAPLFDDIVQLYTSTQVTYTPTLLVSYGGPWAENYYYATEEVLDDPKLRLFTPYEELESRASRRGGGGAGWFRDEEHVFQKHARFVSDLVDAGGRAGVGSHGQIHGVGFHWELWSMQSGGLSEHDALRLATLFGAEAIGFGNDLGSLEAGKLADILVFDESPLENIRNSTAISHIMKNGRLYDAHSLDEIYPLQRPLPHYYWQDQVPETGGVGIP